jgi:hypothetical protein
MRPDDAPDHEMRHHRNPVPPLDAVTAERMLDGTVPEDDVPPDYRDVLRVLAAAAAPAAPAPAAEAAALAAFRSARRPVDPPRRTSVLSKLLGAKAVAAIVLGTATVGTAAAAATGELPDQAQAKAHSIVAAVPDADGSGHAAGSGDDARTGGTGGAAALPGAAGLCQAYGTGSGGDNGKRLDSTALARLADAAGGADKVSAYCKTVTAAASRASEAAAGADSRALAGACHGWLAAGAAGRTPARTVVDRLTAAAGGADAIASYCEALVGEDTGGASGHPSAAPQPTAQPTPGSTPHGDAPTEPPAKGHASGTPAHPAPPTHTD